ncbi:MAG: hypothetical protein MJ198_02065 [Bacteroidales bacterium]|nr:hypothetical protein [Bacteroidales bacterium]
MRRIICLYLACILSSALFAQKNILIVPFDAKMYNNQESEKICRYSEISYDKSIEKIRTDLDMHIYSALKDSMNVSSLLRTYTTDASTDLDVVHNNAVYALCDKDDADINKHKKSSGQNPHIMAGEIVSTTTDNSNKLISVKLQDQQLFSDLIQSYQAQYVVYLTQFELLGDFSNPYSVAENTYQRTIKVHYVIFNSLGKFVCGDIASMQFSAKVNDIDQICDQYLPVVAKKIAKRIP